MMSRRVMVSLLASSVVLGAGLSALAQTTPNKLFFIQRSKNANEVHYDARVLGDGTLDPKTPVDGYWWNKAEDGSRNGISLIQRIAYGFDCDPASGGTWTMKLKALPDRPLTLMRVDGKWRARTTISGQQAYLEHLYVKTDESGLIPKVVYVDIFGDDGAGKTIQEHLVK
jgi:hypothetical protein